MEARRIWFEALAVWAGTMGKMSLLDRILHQGLHVYWIEDEGEGDEGPPQETSTGTTEDLEQALESLDPRIAAKLRAALG